jgi:hypothetical protein
MDNIFDPLFRGIVEGNENIVLENVKKLIDHQILPDDILQKGMIPAMGKDGECLK